MTILCCCVHAGDYHDSEIVVWFTNTYTIAVSARTEVAVHSMRWDPYTVNEFATVGEEGSLCFWLLDETHAPQLSLHEANVPEEALKGYGVSRSFVKKYVLLFTNCFCCCSYDFLPFSLHSRC